MRNVGTSRMRPVFHKVEWKHFQPQLERWNLSQVNCQPHLEYCSLFAQYAVLKLCFLNHHTVLSHCHKLPGTWISRHASSQTLELVLFDTPLMGNILEHQAGRCQITKYGSTRMGLGLFRGNRLGYGLACSDHLAFHGEKTGEAFSVMSACWRGFSASNKLQPGVCGSVVTPREMNLPSTSLPGFTLSTDGNHKDKQDVGFSLSYRWWKLKCNSNLKSLCRMLKGDDCKGQQFHRYPNPPSSRAWVCSACYCLNSLASHAICIILTESAMRVQCVAWY